MKLIGIWETV